MPHRRLGKRGLGFALLTVLCVVGATGFVLWSALGSGGSSTPAAQTVAVSLPADPIVFRSLDRSAAETYGRVAVASVG